MKEFIAWLRTPETFLRAAIAVMFIYMIHNSYILYKIEVMDLSFLISYDNVVYKIYAVGVIMAVTFSLITEFVVLVLLVNGHRGFGRFYAVATFGLNTFYYIYFSENISWPLIIVDVFISFIHFCAIWYLGEEFFSIKFESKKADSTKAIRPIKDLKIVNDALMEEKSTLYNNKEVDEILNGIENINDRKFVCEECNKPFASKYSLDRHISRHHQLVTGTV